MITEWLSSNWQNLLTGGIVAAVIALVVVFLVKNRNKGCGSCGNCGSCHALCRKKKSE